MIKIFGADLIQKKGYPGGVEPSGATEEQFGPQMDKKQENVSFGHKGSRDEYSGCGSALWTKSNTTLRPQSTTSRHVGRDRGCEDASKVPQGQI